jgi:hypothetical protein
MFNTKGEISTVVILGTLVVIGVAALMSSTVNNQKNTTNTRASENSCKNNPVPPPEGGYTWVANCNSTCNTNADCPTNNNDPSNVNPNTSNWCFSFPEGNRCLQLQKGTITNTTEGGNSSTIQPTVPKTGSQSSNAICDKVGGCGGACNPQVNSGCGYYGCRFWEWCSPSGTCIDTTNGNGNNPPGPNACLSKSDPGGENVIVTNAPQATPTKSANTATPVSPNTSSTKPTLTPTTSPNTTDGKCTYIGDTDCITLTPNPTTIACRPGQTRCLSGECVDFQDQCPSAPPKPPSVPRVNPNTPTPTQTKTFIPFVNNLFPTATPVPTTQGEDLKIVSTEKVTDLTLSADKVFKACLQSYQTDWEASDWAPCFLTAQEFSNLLNK